MAVKNKVQLITYPDSLGGDLKNLNDVLLKYFPGCFQGGIHILPPFPSSGDRGFAPLTYLEIEPEFGTWEDIRNLAKNFDILLDLMVNHISQQSIYFQDFLKYGRKSKYTDLFITLDKIWPDGKPSKEEIEKIFLRRTEPYSKYKIGENGEYETVWTTFGKTTPSEQVDLDMNSSSTKQLLTDFLTNFSKNDVKMVRLDAVGYVIKKPGTTCFFVEPEIYQFLNWITELAHSLGIDLLPEVHAHYSAQFRLAEYGHWIYDFILPYLTLEALHTNNCIGLCNYLRMRPYKQFTMLDCHDGIPVKPDMNDLVESSEAQNIVDICLERGANLSHIFSPNHRDPDGFDVHQIRCTYYSALKSNDDAYIAARAIQFFTPGIPQVYYVGLLAGENDMQGVKNGNDGREINRHNFSIEEIEDSLQKPVVQRLINLIRFRNEYPAFDGKFRVKETDEQYFHMRWENGHTFCQLNVDLQSKKTDIRYITDEGKVEKYIL